MVKLPSGFRSSVLAAETKFFSWTSDSPPSYEPAIEAASLTALTGVKPPISHMKPVLSGSTADVVGLLPLCHFTTTWLPTF